MSNLTTIRQRLNLTQEELSERSGVSIRTIQRIEAGAPPKGYTLKMLAGALEIDEAILLEDAGAGEVIDHRVLKMMNLSALPFILFPPLNTLAPLLIMLVKKESGPVAKKIVSIQLVGTLLAALLLVTIFILNDWFAVQSRFIMIIPIVWVLVNGIVILRNAVEINRSPTPHLFPDFSVF